MKIFLIFYISFISIHVHAGQGFDFAFERVNTRIDGTNHVDDVESFLVANNNINYKFLYTWSMSNYFHFKFNLGQKNYTFIDDDGVISNNKALSSSVHDIGFKLIFASWGAVSLYQVKDYDVSYEIVDSTSLKLNAEEISYMRLIYHQLLLEFNGIIFGLDLNYDLAGSNSFVSNRKSTGYKVYMKLINAGWGMNFYMNQQNITKEGETMDYVHVDLIFGASLYFSM